MLLPAITVGQIVTIMAACAAASLVTGAVLVVRRQPELPVEDPELVGRDNWRVPPAEHAGRPGHLRRARKAGLTAPRAY